MHLIPQQICKGKIYDRRSNSQQNDYERNKKSQDNGNHGQTNIGEGNLIRNKVGEKDFIGPKEDTKTQRDCTAGHKAKGKMKPGRLHKNAKEEEHWMLKEELHTWETMAHMKGWQG
eukprot:5249758-Heterocapsa_arctica.AAC.1